MCLASKGTATLVPVREGAWAQTYVDRAADPAVLFGQLPNGLRYAILHNNTPAKQVSVRLLIGSGSISESDAEQGLAHFIEHLAFRGSTHVADGELMRILQRHGLTFGADTNAFTTQESTDYRFDMPDGDLETVGMSLGLLRETASELTFSAASIDAERGVVLAEERQRDSPDLHAVQDRLGFILGDRLAAHRLPIGQTRVIASATPQQLRELYRAIYRPANATVVIVGDVTPANVEALVKEKFGDWSPTGAARLPDRGTPRQRGVEAHLFVEPGATHAVQLAWTRPYDNEADTLAHRREALVDFLAAQIFNQRLREIALAPSPPFFFAQMDRGNLLKSANVTTLGLSGPIGSWPTALNAVIVQQRRMLRDGVTAAELARAKAQATTALATGLAGSATRSTPALANGLMSAALSDRVFTSPAQNLAEYQAAAPTITIDDLNHAFARSFEGSGPLLFLASPFAIDNGEQRLRDVLAAALEVPIGDAGAVATSGWPYDPVGRPGRVVSRRTDKELGVTSVRFANGVDLLIKPTAFAEDQVLVDVRFGNGRFGLPLEQARSFWTLTSGLPLFISGATAKLSASDLQRLLGDRVVGANLVVDDAAFDLQGRTRPQDLARQLELLSAYIGDPGFRPEAFARLKTAMASSLRQIEGDPSAVLNRSLSRRLHGDDPRWSTIPDEDEVEATSNIDLQALIKPALSSSPLGVVIAGKVDVDQAIVAVGATFGAMPPRPRATRVQASETVHFPSPPPS
ncbi:MAG: M16 family metallopeptidase, partial [Janthinobacterium lividum]